MNYAYKNHICNIHQSHWRLYNITFFNDKKSERTTITKSFLGLPWTVLTYNSDMCFFISSADDFFNVNSNHSEYGEITLTE